MKKIFLCLMFFQSILSYSQNSLSGTVKNNLTQEPLVGAVIYFPDFKTGAVTGINGNYSVKNLPKTKTLLQVKMLGYKTVVKQIDLTEVSNLDLEMEESVVEEEEIVVSGTSHATEIKRSPIPMVSIDQKYLSQNASSNIIDAMIKVPGVNAVSTGPNISKPYIRGLGFNRILVLFDGVRQDGQQWGDEHGIEIDQNLVDRIEVIKGPASLIYGSDALAGVVNLIPANTMPEGMIKGQFQGNHQTNNNQISSSLNLAGNLKGFVWGLTGSQKQASNYQNKYDGRVYGTKYKENNFNAYLGLNKSWGYSHLNFSLYDNLQEVPDGSRDSLTRKFTKQTTEEDTLRPIVSEDELTSYKIADLNQRVQHYRLYSSSNIYFGRSKLSLKFGLQQSKRREFGHPQHVSIPALSLVLNTYSYDVKYSLPVFKGWETLLGLNGMYQQNKNIDATEFVIPDYNSFDIGPFIFTKKTFGKLDITAGARYDSRVFRNEAIYTTINPQTGFDMLSPKNDSDTNVVKQFDSYQHTFSGVSGSLGMSYNFSEHLGLKFNIARGYRSPNIAEISAKGVHPGTGFQQLGDANFKPEFSMQEDLGLFFETEHISGSAEAFYNLIDNYIYNEKLLSVFGGDSIFSEGGNDYQVFKFRQTKAQLYGGEFSFDIHPHPLDWLHFENTASLVYASNLGGNGANITDSTKFLPFIPPFHTNSELRADFKKKFACFSSAFIKIGFQYYAAQDRVFSAYNTETKTPAYTLVDTGLGTDIVNKKNQTLFSISVIVNNLADAAYQSNMSRLKYMDDYPNNYTGRTGIYNMGRNVSFKLLVPVNIKKG